MNEQRASDLWRWFRQRETWVQAVGWFLLAPLLAALFLWQWEAGGRYSRYAAVAILVVSGIILAVSAVVSPDEQQLADTQTTEPAVDDTPDEAPEQDTDTDDTTTEPADDQPTSQPDNPRYVTANEFGDDWPLTVDEGHLACDSQGIEAVIFIPEGGPAYAVNGGAGTRGLGVDIDPIWTDNPEMEGTKKNIGPLIDAGLELCDTERDRNTDARLACNHFRNVAGDVAEGVLTEAEFREKIKEVDENAAIAPERVRQAARQLLAATTSGTVDQMEAAIAEMSAACAVAGF